MPDTIGETEAYLMETFLHCYNRDHRYPALLNARVGIPMKVLGVVTRWPKWDAGFSPEAVNHERVAYKVETPEGSIAYYDIPSYYPTQFALLDSSQVKHGVLPPLRDSEGNTFKTRADVPFFS